MNIITLFLLVRNIAQGEYDPMKNSLQNGYLSHLAQYLRCSSLQLKAWPCPQCLAIAGQ